MVTDGLATWCYPHQDPGDAEAPIEVPSNTSDDTADPDTSSYSSCGIAPWLSAVLAIRDFTQVLLADPATLVTVSLEELPWRQHALSSVPCLEYLLELVRQGTPLDSLAATMLVPWLVSMVSLAPRPVSGGGQFYHGSLGATCPNAHVADVATSMPSDVFTAGNCSAWHGAAARPRPWHCACFFLRLGRPAASWHRGSPNPGPRQLLPGES